MLGLGTIDHGADGAAADGFDTLMAPTILMDIGRNMATEIQSLFITPPCRAGLLGSGNKVWADSTATTLTAMTPLVLRVQVIWGTADRAPLRFLRGSRQKHSAGAHAARRELLHYRFGVNDGQTRSFEEVDEAFGLIRR